MGRRAVHKLGGGLVIALAVLWAFDQWPPRSRYTDFAAISVEKCHARVRTRHAFGRYRAQVTTRGECDPASEKSGLAIVALGSDGHVVAFVPLDTVSTHLAFGEVPLTWHEWYRIRDVHLRTRR